MKGDATAVAQCGCAYHNSCLQEYAQMEGRPIQDICCHLHDLPLGSSFMKQNVPSFKTPAAAIDVTHKAAAAIDTTVSKSTSGQPSRVSATPPPPPPPGAAASTPQDMLVHTSMPLDITMVKQPNRQSLPAASIGLGIQRLSEGTAAANPVLHANIEMTQAPLSMTMKRVPTSKRNVPMTGNIGAALGVPCVICFEEDDVLKTLHCGYKAHVKCLHSFWYQKVTTLGRLTDIRCPAEVAGCTETLSECDLRGVISAEDLTAAEQSIQDVDQQNQELIDELKRQSEEYRPMFKCAICLIEHEVEGCCTLPCQHRFCFESLQYHFDIVVRERRLSKLSCPAEGCGYNLRSGESIHIFQECLSEETYHKLLEFLTRDDPHIFECKYIGCEEKVFLDDDDDWSDLACPKGHRFCAKCDGGAHPGMSCEKRQHHLDKERKDDDVQKDQEAWQSALDLGWKPCPKQCTYGGGYKAQEECDHVTCQCGFEFCWDCGVERQIPLSHDNRWHKPSCRYHTKPEEVEEEPKYVAGCPACKQNYFSPCPFPQDDGYPMSYVKRSKSKRKSSKHG